MILFMAGFSSAFAIASFETGDVVWGIGATLTALAFLYVEWWDRRYHPTKYRRN